MLLGLKFATHFWSNILKTYTKSALLLTVPDYTSSFSKTSVFACRKRRLRVDAMTKRRKKPPFSKISAYVWTGHQDGISNILPSRTYLHLISYAITHAVVSARTSSRNIILLAGSEIENCMRAITTVAELKVCK